MRYLYLSISLIFVLALGGTGCTTLDATRTGALADKPGSGQPADQSADKPATSDSVKLRSVGNSQSFVGDDCDTARTVVELDSKGRDAGERSLASFGLRPSDAAKAEPDPEPVPSAADSAASGNVAGAAQQVVADAAGAADAEEAPYPDWIPQAAAYTRGDATIRVQHSRTKAARCYVSEGGTQSPTNANWMERLGAFIVGVFAKGAVGM